MPIVHIDTALSYLREIWDENQPTSMRQSPFCFIVGAGLSYPEVPLASKIVEDLKVIAETKRISVPENLNYAELYSYLFDCVFSNSKQRQAFVCKYIKDAGITDSNFQLALILKEKSSFANTVITTNFDNFIERALESLHGDFLTFDDPKFINKISVAPADATKIIHVHGSYKYYDLKNTENEISLLTKTGQYKHYTIKDYLLQVLMSGNLTPLIIGYSGWNDVITNEIIRRTDYTTAYNYFWFCYNREALENLPDKIKYNNNIYLVLNDPILTWNKNKYINSHISIQNYEELLNAAKLNEQIDTTVNNLEASDVLRRLLGMLQIEVKNIDFFEKPLNFYLKKLQELFPKQKTPGFFNYANVENLLNIGIKAVNEYLSKDDIESLSSVLYDWGRNGKYTEIINKLHENLSLIENNSGNNKIDSLAELYILCIKHLHELNDESFLNGALLNNIIDINKKLNFYFKNVDGVLSENILFFKKIYDVAFRLNIQNHKEQSKALYELILKTIDSFPGSIINSDFTQIQYSTSMHELGKLNFDLNDKDNARLIHKNVIEKYYTSKIDDCRDNSARSYRSLAYIEEKNKNTEEANKIFYELINKFEDLKTKSQLHCVADSLHRLYENYQKQGNLEESKKILNKTISLLNHEQFLIYPKIEKLVKESKSKLS